MKQILLLFCIAIFIVGCGDNTLHGGATADIETTTVEEVYGESAVDDESELDNTDAEGEADDSAAAEGETGDDVDSEEADDNADAETDAGSDAGDDTTETNSTDETPVGPQTKIVLLNSDGFEHTQLKIKVGDTVEWKNVRDGTPNLAMVLGVRNCFDVKSGILNNGESFSWTFEEAETCQIVDGILTTKSMKVIVE